ncbi:MAG: hypothetical protein ABJG47_12485 [Ekhidna sp.]
MAQPQQDTYGTLKGTIGVYEGNCMPGPGVKPCEPRPISTAVFISSLTETYTEELLVKQIQSNNDGTYEVLLPPGKYSLFLGDGDRVVCTLMQCPNTCFCNPFEIVKDSTTVIDAELDHATW